MSNDIINKCCICQADFRPGSLDKDGKCAPCRDAFPTVKTRKDAFSLNHPNLNISKKMTEETVRQIIKEELNEFSAGLKIKQEKRDRMAKARSTKLDKKDGDDGNEGDNK